VLNRTNVPREVNPDLDHLVGVIARTESDSRSSNAAQAELTRRQIIAQQNAVKAQQDAAEYTRQNAKWMLLSVVVVAISSIANLAWQIWNCHQ
jgi:hypothetical protein